MPSRSKSSNETSGPDEGFSLVPLRVQKTLLRRIERIETIREARPLAIAEAAASLALRSGDIVLLSAASAEAPHKGCKILPAEKSSAVALGKATKALIEAPEGALAVLSLTERSSAWHVTLRFASRHKLPVIFLRASQYPLPKGAEDICLLQSELGVPVIITDANDAVALFRVATEAVHNARIGRGPTLIEAILVKGASQARSRSAKDALIAYMNRHNLVSAAK